ncbi:MAG: hypothetical protein HW388_37 [Dehalococcoidia bacterium]|nr:hypothetical protein [Dehalococcoidia bacterium]
MGCLAILAIPSAGVSFFFSSWITMIFWGIIADDVGIQTISYTGAMLVTIALWIAVAPLIAAVGRTMGVRWWRRSGY